VAAATPGSPVLRPRYHSDAYRRAEEPGRHQPSREHRAQHAPRISREGVLFREPPDMAGGPVFSAQRRVAVPQSLGSATGKTIPRNGTLENSYECSVYGRFFD
jgi:hypothetical protein